ARRGRVRSTHPPRRLPARPARRGPPRGGRGGLPRQRGTPAGTRLGFDPGLARRRGTVVARPGRVVHLHLGAVAGPRGELVAVRAAASPTATRGVESALAIDVHRLLPAAGAA